MITSLTSADRTALGRGDAPRWAPAALPTSLAAALRIQRDSDSGAGGLSLAIWGLRSKEALVDHGDCYGQVETWGPGPTSPSWLLLSAGSVWLFWAGCVPPSGVLGLRRRAASLSGAQRL